MARSGSRALAATAVLLLVASSASAVAQSTEAAATALFDDGRKLMMQHRYGEACPKLAESQRLAPSGGTLLNLAECYERGGQTASAWAAWKNAAARANAAGKADVENHALARAAALEPNLARLAIGVPAESDVPGLEVRRDGVVVGRAEYGVSIPVDQGPHVIEAQAPRSKAWSIRIEVSARQIDARVTVELQPEPAPEPARSPPPAVAAAPEPRPDLRAATAPRPPAAEPRSEWGTQKTVAIVALGAAVVAVGVGSVFGVVAMSKNNEALQPQNCRTSTLCTPTGLALTSDARDAAALSNIAFGAGAAALVAGAALWWTAPAGQSSGSRAIRAVPAIARSYGGVFLDGAW